MDYGTIEHKNNNAQLLSQSILHEYEGGGQRNLSLILNNIYPIGSIFISVNSTHPSSYFGGVWEQIKGRFLLGTGANEANTTDYWGSMSGAQYDAPVGQMGGECRHLLTQQELTTTSPCVRQVGSGEWSCGIWGSYGSGYGINLPGQYNTGGQGLQHNNMPPYLSVYMWKRIG